MGYIGLKIEGIDKHFKYIQSWWLSCLLIEEYSSFNFTQSVVLEAFSGNRQR